MEQLFRFFSPDAIERRGRAAADFGRDLEQYIPPNLRPLVGLLVDSNPVMGIDRAGDASARVVAPDRSVMERIGDLGEALSETAGVVAPMGAAAKVGRPAAEAMQEGLLGMSVPARSAAQAVIDRANQPGPVPTMYSNPLMGGGMSDPTQTGWTFRDVSKPITTKADNRRISGDTSRIEEVPINRLYATQPTVNTDFATTSSSAGEMPLVVRKGGKMFVQDGHHRLTKQAEGGAQTAAVRFIDLDNADTSTPLLEWSPEKTGFVEADQDLLDELFAPSLPSPRNEAEAMAKQVLEMRAAGNAGDVTEEMMAAADDQYMYFNTPLPMDEASRMARSQDYDPNYFHGTGSDIAGVDPSKLGEKQNVLGEGFYTTTSTKRSDRYVPKVTDEYGDRVYAEGGNVMPLATKGAGEFDLTAQTGKENITRIANAFKGSDFDVDLRDGGDSAFIKSKTNPDISVYIDSYAEGQNTLARLKDAFGNANLTPIFKEAGFTGLKGLEGAGSNVRVSYNPENVRSRFARFDPEFRHLRNLSAGVGGLGLLSTGIPQEEQY